MARFVELALMVDVEVARGKEVMSGIRGVVRVEVGLG